MTHLQKRKIQPQIVMACQILTSIVYSNINNKQVVLEAIINEASDSLNIIPTTFMDLLAKVDADITSDIKVILHKKAS